MDFKVTVRLNCLLNEASQTKAVESGVFEMAKFLEQRFTPQALQGSKHS